MAKKIYLVHEYGDETHFKALCDCAEFYGYEVSNQIILLKWRIVKKCAKALLQRHEMRAIPQLFIDFVSHLRLRFIKNEILIVGIAPYDTLLSKYQKIFKRNKSYYFTSHLYWDGTEFPKGTIENRPIFEKLLMDCFRGAFCVSATTEMQVKQFFDRTAVVNHAIDYELYRKRTEANPDVRKYIFAGGFTERKNIMLMLDWLRKHPMEKVEFHFAGTGPLKKEIDNAAELDKRIVDLGLCSKNKLQEILCQYDFMLLPSKREPFGISLLEALAAGTPCIVSNAIGPKEIIEDGITGFIFSLDEPEAGFNRVMAASIDIKNNDLSEMRKASIRSGHAYASEEIVKKWMSLLETQY